MNKENLDSLKDLKKKLLGSNYIDEEKSFIKNILMEKEKNIIKILKE